MNFDFSDEAKELGEQARKLLAEVEERELRIAVKRGEYVPIHQVKSEWIA